jgi:iron complex transport system ATP-binding protein
MMKTRKLAVGYGSKTVVDNIELEMLKGQFVCLLGPNGSGKTTILRSLARLLAPLQGAVYLKGSLLNKLKPSQLARDLAVVLTERLSTGLLTAFELASMGRYPYTGFFGRLSEEDRQKTWEALKLVNAGELAGRYFSELSDGEKQKVLLARALVQEPEVIILDEPTSHLDVRHRLEVMAILRRLAREKGITVIASLHDVDLALKTCEVVVLVKDGKIVACGLPEEVLDEKTVAGLYDIGCAHFNRHLGTMELRDNGGEVLVCVVAGAGSGANVYRLLAKRGFAIVTGVIHENDIDCHVARGMGATVIGEGPFGEISDVAYRRALDFLEKTNFVIDAGFPVGPFNRRNVDLIKHCLGQKKIVCTMRSRKDAGELFASPARNLVYCRGVASILETLDGGKK